MSKVLASPDPRVVASPALRSYDQGMKMATRARAVLTGLGVITPIGLDVETVWQNLLAGRSGVKRITAFDSSGLPVHFAGEITDFDAKEYVDRKDRKSLKVMARPIQFAVAGTQMALQDAKIEPAKLDPLRFGVGFGAGLIASELDELGPPSLIASNGTPGGVDLRKWGSQGLGVMPPLWMLKYLPNMLACHVSILHNAQGPNNTITETDVAPLLALGECYRIIQRGQADVMLTGGADSKVNPLSMTRWQLFRQLSSRNEAPERACRPFERRRDGLVLGEGAGVFVLEGLEHARRRGARVLAEIAGFAATFDVKRSGEGLARAIRQALQHASVKPEDIDHINAQGFSTTKEDAWEARGIQSVFGQCRQPVPVFAGKSYFGSLGAGSSAVELAISLLAVERRVLPPTLNYDEPDPECPIAVLARRPHEVQRDHFLKVSFTEIGQCAALVVRRWKE
jgi:3-oxoacyl-[acyl-carrier-protein] synthase II